MSRCRVVDVTGPPAPRTAAPQLAAPPPSAAAPLDPLRLPESPLPDAEPVPAEPVPLDEPLPALDPLRFDALLPAGLPLATDAVPLDVDPLVDGVAEDGEPDPEVELASESTATWPPSGPEQPQKARPTTIERTQTAAREDPPARNRPRCSFTGGSRRQCIGTQYAAEGSIDRGRREDKSLATVSCDGVAILQDASCGFADQSLLIQ